MPERSALDDLVSGLFDYAGMHPPASLSFEGALETSASFPRTLRRPGLAAADLVIEAGRLADIGAGAPERCGFEPGRPFRACLLGPAFGAEQGEHDRAAREVRDFGWRHAEDPVPKRVVSYEVRMAAEAPPGAEEDAIAGLKSLFAGADLAVFAEPDLSAPGWEERLDRLCRSLERLNADKTPPAFGLKVRGSGPAAVDNERLARVVREAGRRGLPVKATAGLHHPILEKERYGNALGFLNLAAALAFVRGLGDRFPDERVLECLETGDPESYRFDRGLDWRGVELPTERLREVRRASRFTIGACSLHEPDADLARLFGT